MTTIHLGFEVGSGKPVEIPLKHMAVTGQTQESGKTTALEALVSRVGRSAIAFVTKRGEGSFADGNRLAPYFRDRADWQFVTSIMDATLQEKNKFLRPWIIRICRTTRTLADVRRAVRDALRTAKGVNEGVYTQLDAYLELIVPEIERATLASSLQLRPGLNVMDLSAYNTPMQMLFVQSAIDWINEHEVRVITIVPEAWEFIPEGKSSPVKASAVSLVRKGAGLGNYIWVDSQDMAGVDKVILRGCTVWLVGVQREANEIKRALSNIPAGIKRPRPADIALLERGQFFACWKDKTIKVYVQPAWMPHTGAELIAKGQADVPPAPQKPKLHSSEKPNQGDDQVANDETNAKIDHLTQKFDRFVAILTERKPNPEPTAIAATPAAAAVAGDDESRYQTFKKRLLAELAEQPEQVRVLTRQLELEVKIERQVLDVDGKTLKGRLAMMIAEGWFDTSKAGNAAFEELKRRGFSTAKPNVYKECDKLAELGFLTKESTGYQAVKSMKRSIREK